MSTPRLRQARALSALCLLALAPRCATTSPGTGGSGFDAGDTALDAARRQEADDVAAQVAALASDVRDAGARLDFTFWAEQGALTLTGYQSSERGGRPGRAADTHVLRRAVAQALLSATRARSGEVALTLRRKSTTWVVEPTPAFHAARPTGARGTPGRARFSPGPTAAIAERLHRLLAPVRVPDGGTVWADVTVHLRDGQVTGEALEGWRVLPSSPDGKPRPVSPRVAVEAAHLVDLYAPARGPRSLHLGLRVTHPRGEPAASGWVEESRVDFPTLPDLEDGVSLR
ncbi:hypothetical protein LZ198_29710 [Myxococcus sp. K15C18031901]|uniref:hypothetical protein n=1 Tax=Myxococcus dinghuensis TaxID=2906761 RepID=UPI0020A73D2C|nr:hypothetical protein [Myxococcus dinghuensis]MCP3103064.1 hypothetical protein [Myxococcus dinghuensis]